ncbi:MAG: formate--tetrahydrofolate ligase [Treponema sp.]|nr:formate--tetrahydrofolate ligase [Treponema sp.]
MILVAAMIPTPAGEGKTAAAWI